MDKKIFIRITDSTIRKKCPEIVSQILATLFNQKTRPVLIAVGGPGGSGKSAFCSTLQNKLPESSILSLDDYRIPRRLRQGRILYGSHPDANRFDMLISHCEKLKDGSPVEKPVYDQVTGETDSAVTFIPNKFVLLDGEISTYQQLRSFIDFSIFIDSDLKTQFATRVNRDMVKRGYSYEKVKSVFLQSNIKDFARFGAESKSYADIILFCNYDYSLEIEAVCEEVFSKCKDILS
jgi:uridine kinase